MGVVSNFIGKVKIFGAGAAFGAATMFAANKTEAQEIVLDDHDTVVKEAASHPSEFSDVDLQVQNAVNDVLGSLDDARAVAEEVALMLEHDHADIEGLPAHEIDEEPTV